MCESGVDHAVLLGKVKRDYIHLSKENSNILCKMNDKIQNILHPPEGENQSWRNAMNCNLVLFYTIHGHISVPRNYPKFDGYNLGAYVRQLRDQGQKVPEGFVQKFGICGIPQGLEFEKEKAFRGLRTFPKMCYFNNVDFSNMLEMKYDKLVYQEQTIMWLMQFMYDHFTNHKRKELSATRGLSNYQGHNRQYFCQWIYKDDMVGHRYKISNRSMKCDGWVGCLAFEERKDTRIMFQVIVKAILRMLSEQFGCTLEVQDILLLVKTSFHDRKKFTKHVDERGNLKPNSLFVGALSFCLLQSVEITECGGVTIYPDCAVPNSRQQLTKCDKGSCKHRSTKELLQPFESVFIPNHTYHQSIYPTGGAQFNLILFIKRTDYENDYDDNRRMTTRSKRNERTSSLILHRFSKDIFFKNMKKETMKEYGDNAASRKKHKVKY